MANTDIFSQLFGSSTGVGADANLNDFKKTIVANDMYRQAAAPVLAAKFNTSTWSPGETLGVTAGQAFLGSLLNGLGARDEAAQLKSVNDILPALYKDPANTVIPDNIDQEAGQGLRASVIATNQTNKVKTDDAIRQMFAQLGGTYDGSQVTPIPGAMDQISGKAQALADAKGATAKGSNAMTKVSTDIGNTIAAIAALNHNDQLINDLEGPDSMLGGVERSAASLVPNTNTYNYIKNLPYLADPLTSGLAGTSKQGMTSKVLEVLHPGLGQDKTSLLASSAEAKQVLIDKAAKKLDVLVQAGWPAGDLQTLKDQLDQASAGNLFNNSYLKSAENGPDIGSLTQQAASIRAQNPDMSDADIYAQLKAAANIPKYGAPLG